MQLSESLKRFNEFVRTVNFSNDAAEWESHAPEYILTREGLTVALSGADAQSYRRCLEALYAAVAPKETLSRRAVNDFANTAFVHIVKKSMSTARDSPEFQSACDHELEQLRVAL